MSELKLVQLRFEEVTNVIKKLEQSKTDLDAIYEAQRDMFHETNTKLKKELEEATDYMASPERISDLEASEKYLAGERNELRDERATALRENDRLQRENESLRMSSAGYQLDKIIELEQIIANQVGVISGLNNDLTNLRQEGDFRTSGLHETIAELRDERTQLGMIKVDFDAICKICGIE